MVYTRQIPLDFLISNTTLKHKIEEIAFSTNHIIRETYQFIRLYFLFLLDQYDPLPLIDRSMLKLVFTLVSNRKKTKCKTSYLETLNSHMTSFYHEHYKPIQTLKVKAVGKDILDYEITSIITNIENHIKTTFYHYINNLIYHIEPNDKDQRKKLKTDLYSGVVNNKILLFFKDDILYAREQLYDYPQKCLPLLYQINQFIESNNGSPFSFLPLRRSFIPPYITLDSNIWKQSFRDIIKKKPLNVWSNIIQIGKRIFKDKSGFKLTSLKTNGLIVSLTYSKGRFIKEKHTELEEYIDDLSSYEDIEGKTIVTIDPNKGNLVYCVSGDKRLRYTQNERRYVSRKTKYKRIRKSVEETVDGLKEELEELSNYNSRTTDFETFKSYLCQKNWMAQKYHRLYEKKIYRKLNWNTTINIRRSEDSFLNKFKRTYGDKNDVIIIFGDWEERQGFLRGLEPTKGKSLRKMFRRAGYKVYLIDEFRTSKVCNVCKSDTESKVIKRRHPRKKDTTQSVWGLLRCTNGKCRRIHNRDCNSAKNMYLITLGYLENGERPIEYRRTLQTSATSTGVGLTGQIIIPPTK